VLLAGTGWYLGKGYLLKPKKSESQTVQSDSGGFKESPLKGEEQQRTNAASTEPQVSPTTTSTQPQGHRLVLNCTERSWVRIYMDDEPVKEYLFNPGDRFEWVAKEGIEIKIGNASGVELEYNGQKIQSLGKRGQVVFLRFPDTFKRRVAY
jgi:hypothetical protein